MPRNGSGSYTLPSGNPVDTGTPISSVWANTTMADIGSAITASIANDGETPILANLPMSGFKHTGVANATALDQYATAADSQNGTMIYLTVAGTNTLTGLAAIEPTTYAAGQRFFFIVINTNTGATTLNINGLGAKTIKGLAGGELRSGDIALVVYDGTTFQLLGNPYKAAASGYTRISPNECIRNTNGSFAVLGGTGNKTITPPTGAKAIAVAVNVTVPLNGDASIIATDSAYTSTFDEDRVNPSVALTNIILRIIIPVISGTAYIKVSSDANSPAYLITSYKD